MQRLISVIILLGVWAIIPARFAMAESSSAELKDPHISYYDDKALRLLSWNPSEQNAKDNASRIDQILLTFHDPLQTYEHRYLATTYLSSYFFTLGKIPLLKQLCQQFPPQNNDFTYKGHCLSVSDLSLEEKAQLVSELAERAHDEVPREETATRMLMLLGNLLANQSRMISGIRVMRRALEIAPLDAPDLLADLKTHLAFAYSNPLLSDSLKLQSLAYFRETIRYYQAIGAAGEENAKLQSYNLAISEVFLFNNYASAIPAFKDARGYLPLKVDIEVFLAFTLAMNGQKKEAIETLANLNLDDSYDPDRLAFLRCYQQISLHVLDIQKDISECLALDRPQSDVLMHLTATLPQLKLEPDQEVAWWHVFYRTFTENILPDLQNNMEAASAEAELIKERSENRLKDLKLKNLELYQYLVAGMAALVLILAGTGAIVFKARQSTQRFARNTYREKKRLQLILDSIGECIYMIQPDLILRAEKSLQFQEIIGPEFPFELSVRDFLSLVDIDLDQASVVSSCLEASFHEDTLAWELNAIHLPNEGRTQKRYLSFSWQPMYVNNQLQTVMLIIRNINDIKALESAKEKMQKTSDYSRQIHSAPRRAVLVFFNQMPELMNAVAQSIEDSRQLQSSMRFIHTIKGTARSLGFIEMRDCAHKLEDQIQKGNMRTIALDFRDLQSVVTEYMAAASHFMQGVRDIVPQSINEIIGELRPGILKHLERSNFSTSDFEISVKERGQLSSSEYGVTRTILLHGLTNALDHGFVLPTKRGVAVQAPKLSVELRIEGPVRTLELRDNGVGLSMDQLRKLARERQWQPEPEGNWADILFTDGVSTADTITESSGRGVGLAAIKQACSELGGKVRLIENDQGSGTLLRVSWQSSKSVIAELE